MHNIKTILFDLDDTLLNRENAVQNIVGIIIDQYYEHISPSQQRHMLQRFIEIDRQHYGSNVKRDIFVPFFDEFPPSKVFPSEGYQEFWNQYFPQCFTLDENTRTGIQILKDKLNVGIITNGSTTRQTAKMQTTGLDEMFEHIYISEAIGYAKPDPRIFQHVLNTMDILAEETLYVGDDLRNDVDGSQQVGIKAVWMNPKQRKNDTDIQPFAEVYAFDDIISRIMGYN